MAHPRTLLRQAVIALLTNATSAGARVFDTQIDPYRKSKLPALSVFALNETIDPDSKETSPRELFRICSVEIVGFVRGTDEAAVATAMDDLSAQIEAAMDADPYIGGAAGDSVLESTEMEV